MKYSIRLLLLLATLPAALAAALTEEDVHAAQQQWGAGIVAIGEAYQNDGDYAAAAQEVLDSLYGYAYGPVLFKPTKAAEVPFRLSEKEAHSYFVGGIVEEDKGFALQPWSAVRFENADILLDDDSALAMGHYYFTDAESGDEVKVEYAFGYFKDEEGTVRIHLHHSSLPYDD